MNVNDITFGCEFETTIPAGTMRVGSYHGTQQAAGLPRGWTAQNDCSIRAHEGRVGCEFVSPVLRGPAGLQEVVTVLETLKRIGAEVNASCGFHVHVGFPTTDGPALDRLLTLVANFERGLYASTGTKARETGTYSAPISSYGDAESARNAGRYRIVNITNLQAGYKPTVEFRLFAGTLNPLKVIAHIRMAIGLVERAMTAPRKAAWSGKEPAAGSPQKRKGAGATQLCRLFYQLGWTKGRMDRAYGDIHADGLPTIKDNKRTLMGMARKYDRAAY